MAEQDQEMPDVAVDATQPIYQEPTELEIDPHERFLRILPGSTETAASFEFIHEDHTLGNALRHIIMKNPDVEFCGYSIPHPAEQKMHLRIQTYDAVNVQDILEKGLKDLMDMCDIVVEKFETARDQFKAKQASS